MNIVKLLTESNYAVRELTPEELTQLKSVFVEIFKDICYACQKHHLQVMLSGGACLGAVRHNGFIPWDDDMDIMLMRHDYDRLPEVLSQEFGNKYKCVGPNISDHTDMSFMRIEKPGTLLRSIYDKPDEEKPIFIDVFPIDNMPDSKIVRLFNATIADGIHYIAICMKYYDHRTCPMSQALASTSEGRRELRLRMAIGRFFSRFTNYTKLFGMLDSFIARYKDKETRDVGVPCSRRYLRENYPRNTILPLSYHTFENIEQAPMPNNPDTYLKVLYGDYMKLPPLDQRKHAFWLEVRF